MSTSSPTHNLRTRDWAKAIRRNAHRVLEGRTPWQNRMTLILALTVALVAAVGVYAVSVGFYSVGYLIFGDTLWLNVATYVLMAILEITLVLPLLVSLLRLACRMAFAASAAETAAEIAAPTLEGLFYPFTSLRAYGRCMAVGLESLGWFLLWVGIPVGGYSALAALFAHMSIRGYHTTLCNLLTAVAFIVCLAFATLMLFLSGKRAGFGYHVFTREDQSLRNINRHFRSLSRSFVKPFVLRLSLTGWIVLSVLGILIPFVIHTIPYALCLSAAYGQEMET